MTKCVARMPARASARVTNTGEANTMEFLLLAAIFLTSAGFLVSAAVAPNPPAAMAPASASGSGEDRTTAPQPRPESPGMNVPLPQQNPEPHSHQ
jgi:hypothetical protein